MKMVTADRIAKPRPLLAIKNSLKLIRPKIFRNRIAETKKCHGNGQSSNKDRDLSIQPQYAVKARSRYVITKHLERQRSQPCFPQWPES